MRNPRSAYVVLRLDGHLLKCTTDHFLGPADGSETHFETTHIVQQFLDQPLAQPIGARQRSHQCDCSMSQQTVAHASRQAPSMSLPATFTYSLQNPIFRYHRFYFRQLMHLMPLVKSSTFNLITALASLRRVTHLDMIYFFR